MSDKIMLSASKIARPVLGRRGSILRDLPLLHDGGRSHIGVSEADVNDSGHAVLHGYTVLHDDPPLVVLLCPRVPRLAAIPHVQDQAYQSSDDGSNGSDDDQKQVQNDELVVVLQPRILARVHDRIHPPVDDRGDCSVELREPSQLPDEREDDQPEQQVGDEVDEATHDCLIP